MDSFQKFSSQFNPQLYESSNVPPSTDKLFSFSGFQAGVMTNQQNTTVIGHVVPSSSSSSSSAVPPVVNNNNTMASSSSSTAAHLPSHLQFRQQQQQQQQHFIPSQQQTQQQQPYTKQQQQPMMQPSTNRNNFISTPASVTTTTNIDNNASGNNGGGTRYSGMYANTGFDMLSVLSRVANRPNPQIDLGPVDLSCSFVVVDARQYDFPIVYVSPMFEKLTGYQPNEAIGRNCRFLQAPDGRVAIGSRRKYTDNTTVYHIKTHMVQGKESQSSIINYRKTGQPFVNLLTVIPIAWEGEEIDYFIGLQVDLVEQPNSIFQSMKDGTYTVNYRNSIIPHHVAAANPSLAAGGVNVTATHEMTGGQGQIEEWTRPVSPKPTFNNSGSGSSGNNGMMVPISAVASNTTTAATNNNQLGGSSSSSNDISLPTNATTTATSVTNQQQQHDQLMAEPPMDVETLIKEASTDEGKFKRCWHELLLDQSPDFIHVLTIKGIFLYCSDATQQVLEYEPSELVGKSLKAICHPSDITTVMRELKQSSNDSTAPVNLIFRVKRKNSGYMWIECCGKLRNEDGRGRKYVVLSGRERPVYQLPRNALTVGNKAYETHNPPQESTPGMEDHEVWGKLSADGLLLYVSWTCANILGSPPQDIIGTSLYQLMRSNRTTDLTRALAEVKEGKIVYLRHALLNNAGMEVMVASTFYPDGKVSMSEHQPCFVLMQTKVIDDEATLTDEEPVFVSMDPDVKKKGRADLALPVVGGGGSSARLMKNTVERMVDELDITRDANWQYELHQLRISNKKLRDELGQLLVRAKQDGHEETAVCSTCFRRLPGTAELSEYPSDEPLLCNTCSFRELQSSSDIISQQQQQQ